jgi:hypothetical protein
MELHHAVHRDIYVSAKQSERDLEDKPKHCDTIWENAKKAPCPAINKNSQSSLYPSMFSNCDFFLIDEECTHGECCCYGHFCPSGTKCYYNAQGICKFVGARMHKGNIALVA